MKTQGLVTRSMMALSLVGAFGVASAATTLYVSTQGRDTWSGTLARPNSQRTDGPKKSIEGARNEIRKLKQRNQLAADGAEVIVADGVYTLTNSILFLAADGGTVNAPIVYRSQRAGKAVLDAGRTISTWRRVTPSIAKFLKGDAKTKVMSANLKSMKITRTGLGRRSAGIDSTEVPPELIFDNARMRVSQYPNDGYLTIPSTHNGDSKTFTFNDSRPTTWTFDNDTWVYGYFGFDWCDLLDKVSINKVSRQATLNTASNYGIKAGQRFKFVNVLEEVDEPGEYYIHQRSGTVYFYPPVAWPSRRASVTFLEGPVFQVQDTANIRFEGFLIQNGRNHGIQVRSSNNVLLRGLTVRNFGMDGIKVVGGTGNGIESCDVSGTGENGIWMSGGNRSTLSPGNNYAVNNWIRQFGQGVRTRLGAYIDGVGNRFANNRIEDGMHTAIGLAGNNNVVEKNEISSVCRGSDDAGAIYIGRDLTMRGNIIRNNFIQNTTSQVIDPNTGQPKGLIAGIYLDDMISEVEVSNNVLQNVNIGIKLGGGRQNRIENNAVLDAKFGFWMDARGTTIDPSVQWNWPAMIAPFNISQPPYSTAYPGLAAMFTDEPRLPKYNTFTNNAFVDVQNPTWYRDSVNTLRDGNNNLVLNPVNNYAGADPGFVNKAARDLRLVPGANAAGFQSINTSDWGLVQNAWRPTVAPMTGVLGRQGP